MELKPKRTYKFWHLLTAFLLGVVLVVGVLYAPGVGLQGYLVKRVSPITTVGNMGNLECAMTNCEVAAKAGYHYRSLVDLLSPATGSLGQRVDDLYWGINDIAWTQYDMLIDILSPSTGSLSTRIDQNFDSVDLAIANSTSNILDTINDVCR